MSEEYWEDYEDFEDFEEEEERCPEGYTWDECCGCVFMVGVETCEFCPFDGKVPRDCYTEDCHKMFDDAVKEMEAET